MHLPLFVALIFYESIHPQGKIYHVDKHNDIIAAAYSQIY